MKSDLPLPQVSKLCGCESVSFLETIQSLWSGYGEIARVQLHPGLTTAIVKHVNSPNNRQHKYGWSGDVSHQRKLSSYDNEMAWYGGLAKQCDDSCHIANLIGASKSDGQWLIVLEDLDASGFPLRRESVNDGQLNACLAWLASFHATFLHDAQATTSPQGQDQLWPIGTYWHLATRPDEYEQMAESDLKKHASAIDQRLNDCRYKTLVHGDAKLANFCFAKDDRVAAVDFQYVGTGCGIKDVAYFVSSCLDESECETREQEVLDRYFGFMREKLDAALLDEVEAEWRDLYAFAWADFYRFLAGWSPGHWKMHRYSERLASLAIARIRK